MSNEPPPPRYSADGKLYWDGQRWVPVATNPGKTPVNKVVTYGCGCVVVVVILLWVLYIAGTCSPH